MLCMFEKVVCFGGEKGVSRRGVVGGDPPVPITISCCSFPRTPKRNCLITKISFFSSSGAKNLKLDINFKENDFDFFVGGDANRDQLRLKVSSRFLILKSPKKKREENCERKKFLNFIKIAFFFVLVRKVLAKETFTHTHTRFVVI